MRKIDLINYDVEVPKEGGGKKTIPYQVKDSIQMALYNPELRLDYKSLFENDRVAQKIVSAQGSVLLEESEYEKLKHAFEIIKGFGKEDVELVRRILEAPPIEVKEVP